MLSKLSIQILEYLNPIFLENNSQYINSATIAKDLHEYSDIQVSTCLKDLETEGFLNLIKVDGQLELVRSLNHKGFAYDEYLQQQNQNPAQMFNFKIGSVSNSAFGNSGDVIVQIGLSFSDIKEYINNQDISQSDKDTLEKLTEYLEILVENNQPINKGFLNKFSDIVSKHSWVPSLIGQALITYFTATPPII